VAFSQRRAGLAGAGDAVFLVDTLGELQLFYAAADVAFVRWEPRALWRPQPARAAVLGLPMLSAAHAERPGRAAVCSQRSGALRIVRSPRTSRSASRTGSIEPESAAADGARGLHAWLRAAARCDRLVAMIAPLLSPPAGDLQRGRPREEVV